jgi:hypothetical protein
MSTLHECLKLMERCLDHCRWRLADEQWDIFTRRLQGTPEGYSVQERWTPRMHLDYYWQRLSRQERLTFLREKRRALLHKQEDEP